jgi:predicted amidohydrolase
VSPVKVALAVPRQGSTPRASLRVLLDYVRRAAAAGADLVAFPEAALTGTVNNDDPRHDLALGVSVPGPETGVLAAAAERHSIWVALGLIERAGSRLYDAAVLISASGRLRLKYRRITPGWHGAKASPGTYGHGRTVPAVRTPFGAVAFLVCGDLFDPRLARRVRRMRPDLLVVPLARSFEDGAVDQRRWDQTEMPDYLRQVRRCGAAALLVNSLDRRTGSFGGAWAATAGGAKSAALPLGRAGMLVAAVGA